MSDEKDKPQTKESDVKDEQIVDYKTTRKIEMFKLWLSGSTYTEIGKKYGITGQAVAQIAMKNGWKKLRTEFKERQFRQAIEKAKDITIFLQDALEADARRLVADAVSNNRALYKEERDHLRALYDRLLKELRLEAGKPTDISPSGVTQVEIRLPPGAKRFGVIPPDPKRVTLVEKPKSQEEDKINLDDLEQDEPEPEEGEQ